MQSTQKGERIRRIYGLALGIWTCVVGILFIVQTWRIYLGGGKAPFTVENISEKLAQIAVPIIIWVLAIIGGVVVWSVFPKIEKPIAYKDVDVALSRLQKRLPLSENQAVQKQRKQRLLIWIWCAVVAVAVGVVTIVILVDKNFALRAETGFLASHGEAERILHTLPWICLAFLVAINAVLFDAYSKAQELKLLKTELADNAKKGIKPTATKRLTLWEKVEKRLPFLRSKYWTIGVRVFVGAVGVVLVIVGIAGGGMADVLEKAVKICTQCIGLG